MLIHLTAGEHARDLHFERVDGLFTGFIAHVTSRQPRPGRSTDQVEPCASGDTQLIPVQLPAAKAPLSHPLTPTHLFLQAKSGRSHFHMSTCADCYYSGGGTRTHNPSVNSRMLCRLSYPGSSPQLYRSPTPSPPAPARRPDQLALDLRAAHGELAHLARLLRRGRATISRSMRASSSCRRWTSSFAGAGDSRAGPDHELGEQARKLADRPRARRAAGGSMRWLAQVCRGARARADRW